MKSTHTFAMPGGALAVPTDLLIGTSWREAGDKRRFDVLNPSTGKPITDVANGGLPEALAAIDAAHAAAPEWAATSPRRRSEILRTCFDTMTANAGWLAELISLENGKSLSDAKSEVAYAAEFFRWYAEEAVRIIGDIQIAPSGANRIIVEHQPIGISLLITPWNFPAAMATRKIAPALAAGCTCILKPAAETPLTALAVAQLMLEAGVPPGVINVLTTDDPAAPCSAILHDGRVRKLSFTGSTEVGRVLLREAADTIISSSMELGGNAPFIVFDDAKLADAIEGAMIAKMRNGGEACTAANRFYVQRGIYNDFAEQLARRMEAVKLGPGTSPSTGCGPLINRSAVEKVQRLVADALSKGARATLGGTAHEGEGYFYPPTVLLDVPHSAAILNEEIFGPVAVLVPFSDAQEAIELANATPYGLVAYVYTSDLKTGLQVSEKLESGMIALNRGLVSDPAAPFGGVKQSGLGREGASHGLLEFTEAKYIAVSW